MSSEPNAIFSKKMPFVSKKKINFAHRKRFNRIQPFGVSKRHKMSIAFLIGFFTTFLRLPLLACLRNEKAKMKQNAKFVGTAGRQLII